jgi:putative ATPase
MSGLLNAAAIAPLAETLRPTSLEQVIGQPQLLGTGQPLRRALDARQPHSMIFWGPPGSGKTSLARLCAQAFDAEVISVSAVLSDLAQLRQALAQAELHHQQGRHTLLLMDEIHRCSKIQQDTLLPALTAGWISLIGATTENPSFALRSALLARTRVYLLQPLDNAALLQLVARAQQRVMPQLQFAPAALDSLLRHADGDARRLLNQLQQCHNAARAAGIQQIDAAWLEHTLTHSQRRFDKGGDQFYDQISALHKSVRGSNPDASLYWLNRMLDGGVELHYLARKILAMACDDIGLADTQAVRIASDAASTCERYGRSVGELALSQAVLYLATTAKSNAVGLAYTQARTWVQQTPAPQVPQHLRALPAELTPSATHRHGYQDPHQQPHGYAAAQHYLPTGMAAPHWYQPVPRGQEIEISERMKFLRQQDLSAGRMKPKS